MAFSMDSRERWDQLERGAGILGSGGGGDTRLVRRLSEFLGTRAGTHQVIVDLDELPDDSFVAAVSEMGSPLVAKEMLPSGLEFKQIFRYLERQKGIRVAALVSAEIGGGNAFTGLRVASELGLPVVDADYIGRAFPYLYLNSANVHSCGHQACYLGNSDGKVFEVAGVDDLEMENVAREITADNGHSMALVFHPLRVEAAKRMLIRGSISKALELGSRTQFDSSIVGAGKITDISQEVRRGLTIGQVQITGRQRLILKYVNEFLKVVNEHQQTIAACPQIITVMDRHSKKIIGTEHAQFGLEVEVIVLDAPALWSTSRGLELLGRECLL